LWWPAHRPLQTNQYAGRDDTGNVLVNWTTWSPGIPQTSAGDLAMVSAWSQLGS